MMATFLVPEGHRENSPTLQRWGDDLDVAQVPKDKTIEYIKNQKEHHHKMTFQEEFLALLKRHRIAYDPRYLWE